jgi:hypothetical protein
MVFEEKRETTEVAVDRTLLNRLCEASGGRLLEAGELKDFLSRLAAGHAPAAPRFRTVPLWDRPWIFLLLCFLLGTDWYLRRRWGLT